MVLTHASAVYPSDIGHLSPIVLAPLRVFAIVISYMYVLVCHSYLLLFAALFAAWQPHICSGGVVQGGFQRAALWSLSAHLGHELKKQTQATASYVLGVLFMPCFWVVCILCFGTFVATCQRVPEGWTELVHLLL